MRSQMCDNACAMKKPARKPLALSTETLRPLEDTVLAQVPGGLLKPSKRNTDCCPTTTI
jgi:hypothetical protein